MKLFDSHCHLDDKTYTRDLTRVIERARSAGVARLMTIGVNGKTSARAVELAVSHSEIYASVGVHPHDAGHCRESVIDDLLKLAKNPKVRAWGEIGLDFNRMYSPREDQEKWFRKQLETAGSLDLPMIFHERDSNGRFLEMLKNHADHKLKGVVHCFSGDHNELERYLDLGLYIGGINHQGSVKFGILITWQALPEGYGTLQIRTRGRKAPLPAGDVFNRRLIGGDHAGPGAGLNTHVANGHAGFHGKCAHG